MKHSLRPNTDMHPAQNALLWLSKILFLSLMLLASVDMAKANYIAGTDIERTSTHGGTINNLGQGVVLPVVSSVSVPANATYTTGQNLDFTVNFNQAVYVNTAGGIPYINITLNTGGSVLASYIAGSGSTALIFRYTVQANKRDLDGIVLGASIVLDGATIQSAANLNANLSLNSVGNTSGILIDSYDAMKLEFNTELADGTTIKLPLSGSVNVLVDWGDGSALETIYTADIHSHTYANEGTYTVQILGTLTGFGSPECNLTMLNKVLSFGSLGLQDLNYAFNGANYLQVVPADLPATVTSTTGTFRFASSFNQNISTWNTENVTDMQYMFQHATAFNQPIGSWNTAKVTNMYAMFSNASSFNQDVSTWNTENVTNMDYLFHNAGAFNQAVGGWNTSNVTTMASMFAGASTFNQAIGSWNTAKVTKMDLMFFNAEAFNQAIGNWNTSNVTTMYTMFGYAYAFNKPLGNWNTSKVTNMEAMFLDAIAFNQDISSWNTENVSNMSRMFQGARTFNQAIGNWNTSNVTSMEAMFFDTRSFNQNISNWNIAKVTTMQNMFTNVTLSLANYDALLKAWAALNLSNGVVFHAGNSKYSVLAANSRQSIISSFNWTITDGGELAPPIITNLSPAKNAVNVGSNPILSITFDRKVRLSNTGTVKIYDGTTVIRTFDLAVTNDRALFSLSSDQLTLSLAITENLPSLTLLAIEFSGIMDEYGIVYPGFTAESKTWIFTTSDTATLPPILNTPATDSFISTQLAISATLPENPKSGSVKLIFTPATGAPIIWTLINARTYNFTLNPYIDPISNAAISSGAALSAGKYTITLIYQDALGNPAASVSNTNITFDDITLTPSLNTPATNATISTELVISATLPETPLARSVRLTFSPTTGSGKPITWVLADARTYNFTLNPYAKILVNSNIVSGSGISAGTYNLTLSYQDALGNPSASVRHTNITFDNITLPPILNTPITNSSINSPLSISATIPETPLSGSVKLIFTPTNGASTVWTLADALSYDFTVNPLSNPTSNAAISSGNALSKGIYNLTLIYQDALGNPAASVTNTNIAILGSRPSDITISTNSISENNAANATVATLSTTDADAGDTFTYTLQSGDTAAFTIAGSVLKATQSFNFENKSSYSLVIRSTDAAGLSFDKTFTININDINDAPTNIALSRTAIYENNLSGAVIGILSTIDEDARDRFSYSLESGDVGFFSIEDNSLKAAQSFNFSAKSSYNMVIRTTDSGGLSHLVNFTITILKAPVITGTGNLAESKQSTPSISKGFSSQLSVTGFNLNTYSWSPNTGLSATNIANPVVTPSQTTTYYVNVTNTDGIQTTVSITVNVMEDYNITPTNLLTPNGDGINDTWIVENLSTYPVNEVIVFDQIGRVVFQTKNYQNNWGGTSKGFMLPEGAYYYIVKFIDGGIIKKGYITLLR
ncbi:MAG: BspA family leucine-rich repeat surface protein [Sphingobacteriaceae bacterium]